MSKDVQNIAQATNDSGLFAPCMVGSLESQFLKIQVQVSGAKRVLDIGTFTGMSALAMAEGLPKDGLVVTLENMDNCAKVAETCFEKAEHGSKIQLVKGNAVASMERMLKSKFLVMFTGCPRSKLSKVKGYILETKLFLFLAGRAKMRLRAIQFL